KLSNPYITTDFSESQLEMITPTYSTVEEAYQSLSVLYQLTVSELGDEYLWPQSMPCKLQVGQDIPIANYQGSDKGKELMDYRQFLLDKYGAKKQLISGLHYNFSFSEDLLKKLYKLAASSLDYQLFKDQIYLKIVRQYIRYRWLLVYLFGASSVFDESYMQEGMDSSTSLPPFLEMDATSFRNSPYGYQNQSPIYVDYTDVSHYVRSLGEFIEQGEISSFKEFYSPIRLKAKNPLRLMESLVEEGIAYLEIRSIDLNPFESVGVTLQDLQFIHLFILALLELDEIDSVNWQQEATENETRVALQGLTKNCLLVKSGQEVLLHELAQEMFKKMEELNQIFHFGLEESLAEKRNQLLNPHQTLAAKVKAQVLMSDYTQLNMQLAKEHKLKMKESLLSSSRLEHLNLHHFMFSKELVQAEQSLEG
ncbi:MAG: bifunctional glutamate--cysteine ligase GshA/glutathione synthetase GshB, partial [Turicibacter sp.]|nr:bifunctional glutamate--cysteine ligase GshA/glutathione synthetase GshB [Turicibacter sp.]